MERRHTSHDKESSVKRRSKEEIETEKKEKHERQVVRMEKKAIAEMKKLIRAKKRIERENKQKEKEKLKLDKELFAKRVDSINKFIKKLKIPEKYIEAKAMNKKECDLIKKILSYEFFKLSVMTQNYNKYVFKVLSSKDNSLLMSVDDIYYLYNKVKDVGINFGNVNDTWLDSTDKIPWNFSVNI